MKNFVLENKKFALTISEDAKATSLIYKKTGEELLATGEDISIFSLTQLRPFNNEVKLAYMNKRTAYEACGIELDGNKMTVSFEIIPCKAIISFDVKDDYISFTLEDFTFAPRSYGNLCREISRIVNCNRDRAVRLFYREKLSAKLTLVFSVSEGKRNFSRCAVMPDDRIGLA